MRRWLLGLVLLTGCPETPHAPERAVFLLKDEIATIGSLAKMPGRRTDEMVAEITSDVLTAWKHVDEIK